MKYLVIVLLISVGAIPSLAQDTLIVKDTIFYKNNNYVVNYYNEVDEYVGADVFHKNGALIERTRLDLVSGCSVEFYYENSTLVSTETCSEYGCTMHIFYPTGSLQYIVEIDKDSEKHNWQYEFSEDGRIISAKYYHHGLDLDEK